MGLKTKKALFTLFLASIVLFALVSLAEDCPDGTSCPSGAVCLCNPISSNTFNDFIKKIIDALFNLAIWISPIMFLAGGYYYLTSAGDPKKVETGKKIIIYTMVGLVIIIAAKGLVELFKEVFEVT